MYGQIPTGISVGEILGSCMKFKIVCSTCILITVNEIAYISIREDYHFEALNVITCKIILKE